MLDLNGPFCRSRSPSEESDLCGDGYCGRGACGALQASSPVKHFTDLLAHTGGRRGGDAAPATAAAAATDALGRQIFNGRHDMVGLLLLLLLLIRRDHRGGAGDQKRAAGRIVRRPAAEARIPRKIQRKRPRGRLRGLARFSLGLQLQPPPPPHASGLLGHGAKEGVFFGGGPSVAAAPLLPQQQQVSANEGCGEQPE